MKEEEVYHFKDVKYHQREKVGNRSVYPLKEWSHKIMKEKNNLKKCLVCGETL